MLAHKTGSRSNSFSGVSLLLVVAVALGLLAIGWARFSTTGDQGTGSSNGFSNYHNDTFHYSISYPSSWKVVPVVPGTSVTTISSMVTEPEQSGGRFSLKSISRTPVAVSANNFSKIDIVAYELEQPITARELISVASSTPVDGAISRVQVAGQDALLVQVQTGEFASQREENLLYRTVFVTKGNVGFVIGGFAETEVFNRILQSFQID